MVVLSLVGALLLGPGLLFSGTAGETGNHPVYAQTENEYLIADGAAFASAVWEQTSIVTVNLNLTLGDATNQSRYPFYGGNCYAVGSRCATEPDMEGSGTIAVVKDQHYFFYDYEGGTSAYNNTTPSYTSITKGETITGWELYCGSRQLLDTFGLPFRTNGVASTMAEARCLFDTLTYSTSDHAYHGIDYYSHFDCISASVEVRNRVIAFDNQQLKSIRWDVVWENGTKDSFAFTFSNYGSAALPNYAGSAFETQFASDYHFASFYASDGTTLLGYRSVQKGASLSFDDLGSDLSKVPYDTTGLVDGSVRQCVWQDLTTNAALTNLVLTEDVSLKATFEDAVSSALVYADDGAGGVGLTLSSAVSGSLLVPDTHEGKNVTSLTITPSDPDLRYLGIGKNVATITFAGTSYTEIPGTISVSTDNANYSSDNGILYDKGKTSLINRPEFLIDDALTLPGSLVSVSDSAFIGMKNLKTLTIEKGITTIERAAFMETDVESVSLPDDLATLGDGAFQNDYSLTRVTFGQVSKLTIGDFAFSGDVSLKEAVIPYGATSLGESVFSETLMKEARIPNTVTTIGASAFMNCRYLEKAVIPTDIFDLPTSCFAGDASLADVTFPSFISAIGISCFEGACSLKNLSLLNCGSIAANAFAHCLALQSVYLSSQVYEDVDSTTFAYCPALNDFYLNSTNQYLALVSGFFCKKSSLTTPLFATSNISADCVYPTSFTALPGCLFAGCSYLHSFTGHAGIASVPENSFARCDNLVSVDLSACTETELHKNAFVSDGKLASILLPETLTTIDIGAFDFCTSLTQLVVPASVTTIAVDTQGDPSPFDGDPSLKIYLKATAVPTSFGAAWNSCSYFNDQQQLQIISAPYYLYSDTKPGTNPTHYWHYDSDGKTPVVYGA